MDFLCLVPVCMIAFVSVAGVEIDNLAYAISAIVLLPINSALNPLIYSNMIGILARFVNLYKTIELERHILYVVLSNACL